MTETTTQTGSGSNTGQMTAVMRAMSQAAGPKVLRIGLVQGGKVIEERIIKQRTHVTVGPSEKSMFVIADARTCRRTSGSSSSSATTTT